MQHVDSRKRFLLDNCGNQPGIGGGYLGLITSFRLKPEGISAKGRKGGDRVPGLMAWGQKRFHCTSCVHCGTTLLERTPYCGRQTFFILPIRPRRDPCPFSPRFLKTTTGCPVSSYRHQPRLVFILWKTLGRLCRQTLSYVRVSHRMNTSTAITLCSC